MIADDEPKIRRGLRTTIKRIRPDMTVVAEAEDGETALALVQKEMPDILMIDVRMPFLSGLDLIERINGILSDCIIIVVSGHDEFKYAQRALQLKVFEYVLKPVPQEMLANVLSRAVEALTESRRQKRYTTWARDQLERNMVLLREQFLRDWVRARLSPLEITEQARFLGMETSGQLAMAVIHVVERAVATAHFEERERRLALYAVRAVVEETFGEFTPLWVFLDDHDNIVVLA
ncbi:MAG: response regulator, partial [Spirochaetes bacterium]|nr:response regulator [Spirochaetota bacterium]